VDDLRLWDWEPRYNIAPGAVIPAVAFNGQKERTVVPMRWGLHPSWRKEPPEGRPLFNARVETAKEKPSFRTPYKRRRALIPTTGWYEWERMLLSCTILTTAAVGDVKHLHHRMPVRLPESHWDRWLDWDENPDRTLETMLGGRDLGHYEVDRSVGNARNEGPDLIRPVAAA